MFSLLKHELIAAGLEGRIRPVLPGAGHVFVLKVMQECPDPDCMPLRICRVCALSERRGPVDFRTVETPAAPPPLEGRFLAPQP